MDKPFLSIKEQIKLLNTRGVKTDDNTYNLLLSEGYYSLVNGYKDPFIDMEKTSSTGTDAYISGTHFDHIYQLFLFDRKLRGITFHYLTKVEVMVRTICCYTFCEKHKDPMPYLVLSNFTSPDSYLPGRKKFNDAYSKFQNVINNILYGKCHYDFVAHYKENHDEIPLWVIANAMTFGNIEHFYDLMKPKEQNKVCSRIIKVIGRKPNQKYLSRNKLQSKLNKLVKIRNICAHDERLYCAEVGRNKTTYVECLNILISLLSKEDTKEFAVEVAKLIIEYSTKNEALISVFSDCGLLKFASKWID
ncbi:Abi family protein [Lancefieldella parvula]|uniref:Abi family protein n=1 Tax=Lancefieldella parvula TaxID=1382 RepID=UPI0028D1EC1C|nr:Abi family protein [Lancefieldella parvula]